MFQGAGRRSSGLLASLGYEPLDFLSFEIQHRLFPLEGKGLGVRFARFRNQPTGTRATPPRDLFPFPALSSSTPMEALTTQSFEAIFLPTGDTRE
jgi:hypothetical protein